MPRTIPGQQFVQGVSWVGGDAVRTSASYTCDRCPQLGLAQSDTSSRSAAVLDPVRIRL